MRRFPTLRRPSPFRSNRGGADDSFSVTRSPMRLLQLAFTDRIDELPRLVPTCPDLVAPPVTNLVCASAPRLLLQEGAIYALRQSRFNAMLYEAILDGAPPPLATPRVKGRTGADLIFLPISPS